MEVSTLSKIKRNVKQLKGCRKAAPESGVAPYTVKLIRSFPPGYMAALSALPEDFQADQKTLAIT